MSSIAMRRQVERAARTVAVLLAPVCVPLYASLGAQDMKPTVRVARGAPPRESERAAPLVATAAMRGDVSAVRALLAQRADVNVAQGDGMTALHWAAERGDAAMTSLLLKAGARVTPVTRNGGYTALHVASRSGAADVVRALLAAGADASALSETGATPLHLAAASGSAAAIRALVARKADVNAREAAWGQTPLMFAAAADRADAVRELVKAGADPTLRTRTMDLTEELARQQAAAKRRNEVLFSYLPAAQRDSIIKAAEKAALAGAAAGRGGRGGAQQATPRTMATQATAAGAAAAGTAATGSATGTATTGSATPTTTASPTADTARGYRPGVQAPPTQALTPAQIQEAILAGRTMYAAKTVGAATEVVPADTTNGFQAGYEGTVGSLGGLTALHHAVRQGNMASVMALLDGGADINEVSASDSTTPLLMAAINGHFDVAMALLQRKANVKLASVTGLTPLYAVINTEWHPKSRYPQPQALQVQKTTHLELMAAIIAAGADVNVRLKKNLWFFGFSNCGNANCGLEALDGTTPFWRAAYAVDVDAMRMLKAAGANDTMPSVRSARAGARGRPGGGDGLTPAGATAPVDSAARTVTVGSGTYPIHAAAGVGYGNGFAGNAHRHAPDGWMPAMRYLVEELHADVNKRDAGGYTPLHHAAARGDNEMILYLVSKGADPKAVARNGQTTVDMANGPVQRLRPFPETILLLEKLGAKNNHKCVSC